MFSVVNLIVIFRLTNRGSLLGERLKQKKKGNERSRTKFESGTRSPSVPNLLNADVISDDFAESDLGPSVISDLLEQEGDYSDDVLCPIELISSTALGLESDSTLSTSNYLDPPLEHVPERYLKQSGLGPHTEDIEGPQ